MCDKPPGHDGGNPKAKSPESYEHQSHVPIPGDEDYKILESNEYKSTR